MNEHSKQKEAAALASVGVSSLMTLAKFAAGLASGSLAVLSEAGHNLADVAATLLTFFAVRVADKPADEEHQFGHAKVEAVAALIETGFLFALAVYITIEAASRLFKGEAGIEAEPVVFAVLIGSMFIDFFRWFTLRRVAATTKSDALAADALHFSSDIVGTGLALCGITAAAYGYPQGDAVAALGLALFIVVGGLKIGRRTINALVDTAPEGLTSEIRLIARLVPGVIGVEALRLRPAGAQVFGDMSLMVSRTLPLEKAAAIEANVKSAISARYPEISLMIMARPVALNSETIAERVLLIAARRRVAIHHVTVQEIDERISISFDIELDRHMTHGTAHEIASGMELKIRQELGANIEVETHIEPLELYQLKGHPVAEGARSELAAALEKLAEAGPIVDIHNVRARATPEGLVVNYHCRASPHLCVGEVHDCVDEIDRKMRDAFPGIVRIIGHAEPLPS
ncbi:MAG TPA: cation diffusion facilitator family transporter [Methylocella sp.]|nr:cation diffusion facilitator family transporter [Methylocella sp.]